MAEDGEISERYPLIPLPNGDYRQRTRLNVLDSDGTAIIYYETLKGGTRLTRNLCALLKRPHVLIDARQVTETTVAAELIGNFIDEHEIKVPERRGATVEWMERGICVCAGGDGRHYRQSWDLDQAVCGDRQE
jgi:hypothetical protein